MKPSQLAPSFSLLLVDDEKSVREIMSNMVALKYPQCIIYTAEDGEDGLNLFMKHTPDIIITDHVMPKMDGVEFVRKIRAENYNNKCLVISGSVNIDSRFAEIGNCVNLCKPVDCNTLFSAIEDCLLEME